MRRALLAGCAALLLAAGCLSSRRSVQAPRPETAPFAVTEVREAIVRGSFDAASRWPVATGTRILLVPHHLVAGREIASLLASTPAPKRVILLSPDHFSQGKQAFSTEGAGFAWNGRPVGDDPDLRRRLLDAVPGSLAEQAGVFMYEHGVRGLIPFFATAWPDTRLVPITVRVDTRPAERHALAAALHGLLNADPDLLVVATVDFSHDLPAYVADVHDRLAIDVLRSLDHGRAARVEADSPALVGILAELADADGLGDVRIHAHTNALRLMNARASETGTSHILASFAPGAKRAPGVRTSLHFPSMFTVSSAENRFYQGYDALVPDGELHAPVAFVLIDGATGTERITLPFKQAGGGWLPLNDDEYLQTRS